MCQEDTSNVSKGHPMCQEDTSNVSGGHTQCLRRTHPICQEDTAKEELVASEGTNCLIPVVEATGSRVTQSKTCF